MKTILVIYYTQTGQLKQILDSLLRPLAASADFSIDYLEIKPSPPFPFPWTKKEFLNVFPESVREVPVRLEPLPVNGQAKYDLVLLAFQPWYLSPSPPVTTFLKSPEAGKIINGADVLTVIGSRNMWQGAFERVRAIVESLGGCLRGNISFIDRAPNLASVITIVYWLFTGKKDKFLGIFPRPGVSDADIADAARYGKAMAPLLLRDRLEELDQVLRKLGAVEINDSLARLENRAKKVFTLWAKVIIKNPKIRPLLLHLFLVELVLALVIISPLNTLLGNIMKIFSKGSDGH